MKKLILVIATIFLAGGYSFAQEKAFAPVKFGDHWFIQLQGGATYTVSEYRKDADFGDLITPHVALSLGKYFSPVAGARLQVGGWQSKNYFNENNADKTYKVNYIQTNLDGLLNLTNLFMPYSPDRGFNLNWIVGVGYAHGFSKDNADGVGKLERTNSFFPRTGLQADFRLSDAVNFNIEVAGNLLPDNFNGIEQGKKYDGTINAMLGLTYKFTKGGFKMVETADPALIASLNDQINQQRANLANKDSQISNLQTELAKKPKEVVVEKAVEKTSEETEMNAVVVFRIGSAKLEQNQDINIYNAARYLQDNPSVNVIVTGYADNSTGTATINQRLSEQRAEAVARVLIDKYNISPNRITTKASGDKVQLFPTPQWNRVVVFTAVSK